MDEFSPSEHTGSRLGGLLSPARATRASAPFTFSGCVEGYPSLTANACSVVGVMDQRLGRAYYRELVINEDKSMEDSLFLHKAKP